MDPPPPPRGILRLNPQAAPFQPPPSASVSGVAASRAPVASVPPSSGVAAKNKKNKNKNKQKDAPGRKKGQRDNFGPKGLDKPVPPPPVPVVAASAPPVQSVKPVQPAVVLVLNGGGKKERKILVLFSTFFFFFREEKESSSCSSRWQQPHQRCSDGAGQRSDAKAGKWPLRVRDLHGEHWQKGAGVVVQQLLCGVALGLREDVGQQEWRTGLAMSALPVCHG